MKNFTSLLSITLALVTAASGDIVTTPCPTTTTCAPETVTPCPTTTTPAPETSTPIVTPCPFPTPDATYPAPTPFVSYPVPTPYVSYPAEYVSEPALVVDEASPVAHNTPELSDASVTYVAKTTSWATPARLSSFVAIAILSIYGVY
jgi:hypothetical protein